jgi:hypothetical protein
MFQHLGVFILPLGRTVFIKHIDLAINSSLVVLSNIVFMITMIFEFRNTILVRSFFLNKLS